jgi:NAD(P) transhydrogenase subunit alpha
MAALAEPNSPTRASAALLGSSQSTPQAALTIAERPCGCSGDIVNEDRAAMKVGIIRERRAHERRVAASPDTVKHMAGIGLAVLVESGAGEGAYFTDEAYRAAGAQIVPDAAAALSDADIVLKVQRPLRGGADGGDEVALMKPGAALIGLLQPLRHPADTQAYAQAGLTAFAMELMPRITRAQTMDVLSSQANLAGYRAVLEAAEEFGRALPMMMTAAGTIKAARVLVMGAGVAGLQAIATARRLGAIVSATDVRAAAREQVESLGATFVTVDEQAMKAAETSGGYAREMDEDFQRRQREKITETLRRTDIVICTALIPGKKAPTLVTQEMVEAMAPGSVIVDLAAERGGNCELTQPDKVVVHKGVTIIGPSNPPALVPYHASQMYAKNITTFLNHLLGKEGAKKDALDLDLTDEITRDTLLTRGGEIVHARVKDLLTNVGAQNR